MKPQTCMLISGIVNIIHALLFLLSILALLGHWKPGANCLCRRYPWSCWSYDARCCCPIIAWAGSHDCGHRAGI